MYIRRLVLASLGALAVSLLGMTAPRPAAAAGDNPVTIALTATVAAVEDPAQLLGGAIRPGDSVTGTYTYNTGTNDTNTLPTVGDYWHTTAPYGMSLTVGGRVFQTDPQNVRLLVEVANNHNSRDGYLVHSYNNRPLSS